MSGSIGWGAGLQTSRLGQSKISNPIKVLNKEYKVIYLMYKSAKFGLVLTFIYIYHLHFLTVTLLNNSVELPSNLDAEPLKSGIGTLPLKQSIELLSGSIGWGTGLQTSRLLQSMGSNTLKVLNKEYKVIYLMYKSAKFGLVLTVIYIYHIT